MGSGKSKTGSKLARDLNYKFCDLDLLIEQASKKTIKRIFHEDGESVFREIETKCLNEVIKFPSLVVATGGGVILKNQNWGILRQGIIIWLDIDSQIAIKRLESESNNRPLLDNKDIHLIYFDILNKRKELYAKADIRINIFNENVEQVSELIVNSINKEINQ